MAHSMSVVRLVKGRGPKAQRVLVGVSVKPGLPSRKAHFKWAKRGHRLHLHKAACEGKKGTSRDLFLECMIACVAGVENFRRECPSEFDCEFTVLEGRDLLKDYTVGFSLATFRAVAAATGFLPDRFNDRLKGYGWSVSRSR